MTESLEERLRALESEFETGKKMLAEVEAREASLKATLLRISGAIQVLREFVPESGRDPAEAATEMPSRSVVAN